MTKKTIVILANSIKHNQHCVAGKCIETKKWIRPVGDTAGCELTHEQAKSKNPHGKFNVKPLQKTIIGLDIHAPLDHQPENYVIDSSEWQQRYKINNNELQQYLDTPVSLWGSGGLVPHTSIQLGIINITQSLYLVSVESLKLYINQNDKRRASFIYSTIAYDFAVTDPNFDAIVANGTKLNGIICVSLGEPFYGNCYKLVATVFLA